MEYDYYKLYLARNFVYNQEDMCICSTLDEVWDILNNAYEFNWFILVGHSNIENKDDSLEQGEINFKDKPFIKVKTNKRKR
jgi:hypothetical protein